MIISNTAQWDVAKGPIKPPVGTSSVRQPVLCEDIVRLVEMFCYLFELEQGNANAGLVHRSPALSADEQRLLLNLDLSADP